MFGLAVIWAVAVCPTYGGDEPVTCVTCHPSQRDEQAKSVHATFRCQECHQGEASYAVAPSDLSKYVDAAGGSLPAFDHGASFAGKPSRAEVPRFCGECHANVERMNPYGLRTDQLARYWTSSHGKTLAEKGDDRVAVCIDCHGSHDVMPGREPASKTYPLNVPETCGQCHEDATLMAAFDLPVAVMAEYRESVHGQLLFEQQDTGAPTCATCHGNHSAVPPGFATVGAVCGQCHQHAAENFATSIHATLPEHKGCVQCHGGGEGRHFHLIERITKPSGLLIQRYLHLLRTNPDASPRQVAQAAQPDPKQIITRALPTCMDCHEELEDDESLPKLFGLLDAIAEAEAYYVRTGARLEKVGRGVLLVDRERFLFEDA
jgi:cytochrome c553